MAGNEPVMPGKGKDGKVFQIVVSLILFVGFVVMLFYPAAYADNSVWAMILNAFQGEYSDTTFLQIALYVVVGFYVVMLACTVISLFVKKNAAIVCNYIKSFVALLAFGFLVFGLKFDLHAPFSEMFLSEKTFFAINSLTGTLGLAALAIIVLNFAAYKVKGIYKFVFLVLAVAFFVFCKGFTFVDDLSFVDLFAKLDLGEGVAAITGIAFSIFAWASLVNLALAFLTVILPRTSMMDLVRSVCMFVFAVFALIMLGVYSSFGSLFDYIGTVGVTGVALVQLVYAIIVVCVLHAKNKKQEALEDAAEDESPFVGDENEQMAIKGLEAPAAEEPVQEEPVYAQAPVQEQPAAPQFTADAAEANDAFEDATQISIDDIAAETQKEEEAAAQEEIAAEEAVREEEKEFDFEQAKFDGKFNRAYAEFAEKEEQQKKQEEQQKAQQQQQAQQQPFYGYNYQQQQQYQQPQTPPPYYGTPYAQPYGAQGYYNMGFVPDMFISSLTPAEREEFDRLFITRIYGDNKRLPAYQIGGDNREFFTKIFVFMGRYRNVISEGLLEKIYNYSNAIK